MWFLQNKTNKGLYIVSVVTTTTVKHKIFKYFKPKKKKKKKKNQGTSMNEELERQNKTLASDIYTYFRDHASIQFKVEVAISADPGFYRQICFCVCLCVFFFV